MKEEKGRRAVNDRLVAACSIVAVAAWGEVLGGEVVLKKAFVTAHMNRATVDASFAIEHAHKNPNPIHSDGDDGDLHMSGRSTEVGLPMVVEIVNAKGQGPALTLVKNSVDKPALPIAGAWRLWFEHPATTPQIQGDPVPKPANTNPPHVFEIHPVTQIQALALLSSIADIPGFAPYEAATAFPYFEGRTATLQSSPTSITIEAKKAVYNYVGFVIALTGAPKQAADGVFVLAKVLDAEGNVVVARGRRMVFVAGTDAEQKVRNAKKGDRFSVVGIPRVNLERVNHLLNKDGPGPIDVKLPYEMIILGAEEL